MRDGLSLLDQCASATAGELNAQRVYACLGIAGEQTCAELMGYIAAHDSAKALALFNRLYAEGKDLSAMLDELACLTRDLMVLKTAGNSGITMLSGVSTEREAGDLSRQFSSGELMRMMTQLQQTLSSFTRSASRRMDAELCILSLCQPELSLDAESLNARLTRLEEQIKSGSFVAAPISAPAAVQRITVQVEEEMPPVPGDEDAPPVFEEPTISAPVGFWTDLAAAVRRELKPPVSGFFAPTPNAPVQGILQGNTLVLRCSNSFTLEQVNKPAILELVGRKVSAQLGQPIRVTAVDKNSKPEDNAKMDQLLSFGRAHSDIIHIKD
jgi:DNA polymerase-3 subunit gamma/tau